MRSAARRAASRSPSTVVPAWSASILRSFSSNVPSRGTIEHVRKHARAAASAARSSTRRQKLGALAGEGLGLVDTAHDGTHFVARGQELARDDGPNVTGGTCDDEDGHGDASDGFDRVGDRCASPMSGRAP